MEPHIRKAHESSTSGVISCEPASCDYWGQPGALPPASPFLAGGLSPNGEGASSRVGALEFGSSVRARSDRLSALHQLPALEQCAALRGLFASDDTSSHLLPGTWQCRRATFLEPPCRLPLRASLRFPRPNVFASPLPFPHPCLRYGVSPAIKTLRWVTSSHLQIALCIPLTQRFWHKGSQNTTSRGEYCSLRQLFTPRPEDHTAVRTKTRIDPR